MLINVPCVDNCVQNEKRLTFVNKKGGIERNSGGVRKERDTYFGIRGELCNFAPEFDLCA